MIPETPKPPLTKIIATLGPASSDAETVGKLIEAGASIFRLNFSHGDFAGHRQLLDVIRKVSEAMGRPIGVLGDLPGPKMRIGKVIDGGIEVTTGETVVISPGAGVAEGDRKPFIFDCTYVNLVNDVEVGQRVLINDGAVRMLVVKKTAGEVHCAVTFGGVITSSKGINLPDSTLSVSAFGERDRECVQWAVENDIDFLALSFVSRADEIVELRQWIEQVKASVGRTTLRMPIIAKIERPCAVDAMEEIAREADAIMVARGDLGVEMDLARVPVIQKRLITMADSYGKPCIVATQMLESMITSPTPTRAEASDVANAIFDGADAVMLSAETAAGKFPTLAVETMRRIAEQTEAHLATLPQVPSPPQKLIESRYRTAALAHGVWTIAQDIAAKFVVVWSQQGGGARYLSQNRFTVPIIAASTDHRALRQMSILRGVIPVRMMLPEGLGHFTDMVDMYLQEAGWANAGDPCILMAGSPIGRSGVTNSLAIHSLGDPATGFARAGQ